MLHVRIKGTYGNLVDGNLVEFQESTVSGISGLSTFQLTFLVYSTHTIFGIGNFQRTQISSTYVVQVSTEVPSSKNTSQHGIQFLQHIPLLCR